MKNTNRIAGGIFAAAIWVCLACGSGNAISGSSACAQTGHDPALHDKTPTGGEGDESAARSEFMSKYPSAVQELQRSYEDLSIAAIHMTGKDDEASKKTVEYLVNGPKRRWTSRELVGASREQVVKVVHPELSFTIRRRASNAGYDVLEASRKSYGSAIEALDTMAMLERSPFCLCGESLAGLLHTKGFSIKAVERFFYREPLMKVHFLWNGRSSERRGWFVVASERKWVITESRVISPRRGQIPKASIVTTVRYAETAQEIPTPSFVVRELLIDDVAQERETCEIRSIEVGKSVDDDFRLTAFVADWKPSSAIKAAKRSYAGQYWSCATAVAVCCAAVIILRKQPSTRSA